jgi:hypothetical protein
MLWPLNSDSAGRRPVPRGGVGGAVRPPPRAMGPSTNEGHEYTNGASRVIKLCFYEIHVWTQHPWGETPIRVFVTLFVDGAPPFALWQCCAILPAPANHGSGSPETSCGAARGTTIRTTPPPPSAPSAITLTTVTTTTGFGWWLWGASMSFRPFSGAGHGVRTAGWPPAPVRFRQCWPPSS